LTKPFAPGVKLSSDEGLWRPSSRHGCAISRNFVLGRFLLGNIDKCCRANHQLLQSELLRSDAAQLVSRSELLRSDAAQLMLQSELVRSDGAQLMLPSELVRLKTEQPILWSERQRLKSERPRLQNKRRRAAA